MENTYQIKNIETSGGIVEILEMTTPDGTISTVPMVVENLDYQRYLESLEA